MPRTPDYADVPSAVLELLRSLALALPDSTEQPAWTGVRWMVRRRTFAHLFSLDSVDGPTTMVVFRSPDPERGFLLAGGHPFFAGRWGTDVVGMLIEDSTDWTEVAELITESYRVMAPKKLAERIGPVPPA